jgi:hypothetical protein
MTRVAKLYVILTILFFGFSVSALSDPVKVKSGVYITHLYDVNFAKKSVNAIFWLWFIYPTDSDFQNHFSIDNSENWKVLFSESKSFDDGITWKAHQVQATLYQNWNFEHFPNGDHQLKIIIGDYEHTAKTMQYIPDVKSSDVDNEMKLNGWVLGEDSIVTELRSYDTNFGYPGLTIEDSVFPKLVYTVDMEQSNTKLFFKVFGLLYLACFLILCVYFVPIDDLKSRLALNSAAIFSVVGNKLATDDILPPSQILTLIDKLQLYTLALMVLLLGLVVTLNIIQKRNLILAKRLNILFGLLSFLAILVATLLYVI